MWLVLLAALGLLTLGGKKTAGGFSQLWARHYLVQSAQQGVFELSTAKPFNDAPKALTLITNAIGKHGSPVYTTPDGHRVAFAPLSERETWERAGFILYADGRSGVIG